MELKERILTLVKEGTLSMEEAVELLENIDESPEEPTDVKQEETVDEEAIQKQIESLLKKKEELEKEHTITAQRERELEVLQEFDDLTFELEKDLQNYTAQKAELKQQITALDEEIDQLKKQMNPLQWQDVAEDIKQTVQEATEKVTAEGEKLFNNRDQIKDRVTDFVKGALNHYTVRSVGDYFGIQWAKATTEHQTYELDATNLNRLELTMPEGEWEIKTHSKPTVYIEGQWALYGDPKELASNVAAWHQVKVEDGLLRLVTSSGQVAFKGVLYLPERLLEEVTVKLEKGQVSFDRLNVETLVVEGKSLQCRLTDSKVQGFNLNLINGKLDVDQSTIEMSKLSIVKGDIRYIGSVGNIQSTLVYGHHYITKADETSSVLDLSSVKGNIKVAVPNTVSLTGEVKQTAGNVLQRLLDGMTQSNESSQMTYITRQVTPEEATVSLQATLTAGDVYLKDYHQN